MSNVKTRPHIFSHKMNTSSCFGTSNNKMINTCFQNFNGKTSTFNMITTICKFTIFIFNNNVHLAFLNINSRANSVAFRQGHLAIYCRIQDIKIYQKLIIKTNTNIISKTDLADIMVFIFLLFLVEYFFQTFIAITTQKAISK